MCYIILVITIHAYYTKFDYLDEIKKKKLRGYLGQKFNKDNDNNIIGKHSYRIAKAKRS